MRPGGAWGNRTGDSRAAGAPGEAPGQRTARHSRTARVGEDLKNTGRFAYQLSQGVRWVGTWLVEPALAVFLIKIRWIWRQYRRLWSIAVYRRDADRELVFSKTRAGAMVLAT